VQARVPPEPVNLDDIKRLYTYKSGRPCYLTDDAFDALKTLDLLRAKKRQLDDDMQACEWRIAKHIADAWGVPLISDDGKLSIEPEINAALYFGDAEVGSWKRTRGTYLDQAKLRADHPDLVRDLTVEHHYRTLRLKKPKGQK
jgi:hypothetical protein